MQLLTAVDKGDVDAAKAALQAGASVNGPPDQPHAPIVTATIPENVAMVKLLLEQGADPDRPVKVQTPWPGYETTTTCLGERALHIAVRGGNIELVQMLLDAGSDPALPQENGLTTMHGAAGNGHVHLVDMLHSRAPGMLSRCGTDGETPLFVACFYDNASMASKLLSLGAMQPIPRNDMCPLMVAIDKGFEDVARVLITEGGIKAVGGRAVLLFALQVAIGWERLSTFRLLLAAEGEDKRSEWANMTDCEGRPLLHFAAGCCCSTVVRVLLEAGADEGARDWEGRLARDVLGVNLARDDKSRMERGKEIAVRRMLQRGPAYRARSWAWPSDEEEVYAGGRGDGNTSTVVAVFSPPPAMKTPTVQIFRPKEKDSSGKFFVGLVGRYCAKD